jgi:hypothetical protein
MSNDVFPGPSLESQIIFRLASLEAIMTTSLSNINEKLDTLQKDFHHKDVNRATQIAALETRLQAQRELVDKKIEDNNKEIHARVTKLEFFRTELVAKAMAAAAVEAFKTWIGVK